MSTVISCPSCHGDVALPPDATPVLICPLCQAEFTLQPVLAMPDPADHEGAESAEAVDDEAPMAEPADGEPPLAEPAANPAPVAESAEGDDADLDGIQIATGEAPREDALSVGIDDGQSSTASTASKAKSRARKRGPGPLGQLIGIVGGGFIGLAVGYFILTKISPRYNFLNLSLPWIEQAESPGEGPEAQPAPTPRRPSGSRPSRPVGGDPTRPAGGNSAPPSGGQPTAPRPQQFTAAQLGEALGEANIATGCATCNSRGYVLKQVTVTREFNGRKVESKQTRREDCEACGGNPSAEITPAVYGKLCRLAHVVTNVRREPGVQDLRSAVETVLARATNAPDKVNKIVQQAAARLDNRSRPDPGVLLVGIVENVGQRGDWHTIELVLLGNPRTVTVVTGGAPGMQPGENVVIAGSIVQDPSARLQGYAGREPQVVHGGMPLKLKSSR